MCHRMNTSPRIKDDMFTEDAYALILYKLEFVYFYVYLDLAQNECPSGTISIPKQTLLSDYNVYLTFLALKIHEKGTVCTLDRYRTLKGRSEKSQRRMGLSFQKESSARPKQAAELL